MRCRLARLDPSSPKRGRQPLQSKAREREGRALQAEMRHVLQLHWLGLLGLSSVSAGGALIPHHQNKECAGRTGAPGDWDRPVGPPQAPGRKRSRNNQLATIAACSHVQASSLCLPKGHHFRSTLLVFAIKSLKLRTHSCSSITFRTSYTGAANSLRGCSKGTCALRSRTTSKPRPHWACAWLHKRRIAAQLLTSATWFCKRLSRWTRPSVFNDVTGCLHHHGLYYLFCAYFACQVWAAAQCCALELDKADVSQK